MLLQAAPIIGANWRSFMIMMITSSTKSRKAWLLFSYNHILANSIDLLLEVDLSLDSLRLETSNGFFFGLQLELEALELVLGVRFFATNLLGSVA